MLLADNRSVIQTGCLIQLLALLLTPELVRPAQDLRGEVACLKQQLQDETGGLQQQLAAAARQLQDANNEGLSLGHHKALLAKVRGACHGVLEHSLGRLAWIHGGRGPCVRATGGGRLEVLRMSAEGSLQLLRQFCPGCRFQVGILCQQQCLLAMSQKLGVSHRKRCLVVMLVLAVYRSCPHVACVCRYPLAP